MTEELLRASSLYRDTHCFASRRMAKEAEAMGVVPPAETEWTQRGTRVHAGQPQDQDERDAHEFCEDQLIKQVNLHYKLGDYLITPTVLVEQRFYLRDGLVPYFTGQPDRVFLFPDLIIFGDYKPGFEADWEAWEWQMRAYYALLYENFQIREITGIISTRFYGTAVYDYSITPPEEVIGEIKETVARHNDPNALPNAGPWCRYCKARLICKEALNEPLATYYHPTEQLPAGIDGALIVEKLKLIIKLANDRLAWYKAKMIDDPKFLGGEWVLNTRKTRSVIDTKAAATALVDSGLMSLDGVMSCMKLSLPDAQKIMRITNAGMTQKAAKDALVETLGTLLIVQESEPFLVKAKEPKELE